MAKEIKDMNIYERLSAITLEITGVEKDLTVGFGGASYKAIGESQVLRAVKKVEAKYGVYSYPCGRKIIESGQITSEKGKVNMFERIETVYRFVNMNNPAEFIDIVSYGDGVDSQDKSVGKAMTYADKYALMKAYKITTGEDPDQEASEPLKSYQTSSRQKALEELRSLGVNAEDVAKWLKKGSVDALTEQEIRAVIDRKKNAVK